jgi:hypothetical protein
MLGGKGGNLHSAPNYTWRSYSAWRNPHAAGVHTRVPFDWITDDPARVRAPDLHLIRTAVEQEWLIGPELATRRLLLVCAVCMVCDHHHVKARRALKSLCLLLLMDRANLR